MDSTAVVKYISKFTWWLWNFTPVHKGSVIPYIRVSCLLPAGLLKKNAHSCAWFSCSGWECVCSFQRGRAGCYSIEGLTRPFLCRFVILHAEDRMCNLILTHDLYWIVCLGLFLWQFHGTVNSFSLLGVIFHKSIGFFWALLLWLCVFSNCCLLLCTCMVDGVLPLTTGRPIFVDFSPVTDFREATCRQYEENTCNRGGYCNFMHLKKISRSVSELMFIFLCQILHPRLHLNCWLPYSCLSYTGSYDLLLKADFIYSEIYWQQL